MSATQDEQYLTAELFEDGDAEIRNYKKKIVVTRVEHTCMAASIVGNPLHQIAKGSRAIKETALAEGVWGTSYSCLPCVDKFLEQRVKA